MNDYLLLMHDDVRSQAEADDPAAWAAYLGRLQETGRFDGGSAIGPGACFRRAGPPAPGCAALTGFLRVRAASLDDARAFLEGNPTYEAGGTVELRLLPPD